MASPEDTEKKEPEGKSGGGGLMGLIALGVVSLGASFAVSFLTAPSSATETAQCAPAGEGFTPAPKDQAFTELRDVVVTVGSAPATRYLKMKVAVVTHKDDEKAVRSAEPALVDAFVNYLRSVELADMEDPAFYADMREQLSYRSELVLGESVSNGVLITEFLLR